MNFHGGTFNQRINQIKEQYKALSYGKIRPSSSYQPDHNHKYHQHYQETQNYPPCFPTPAHQSHPPFHPHNNPPKDQMVNPKSNPRNTLSSIPNIITMEEWNQRISSNNGYPKGYGTHYANEEPIKRASRPPQTIYNENYPQGYPQGYPQSINRSPAKFSPQPSSPYIRSFQKLPPYSHHQSMQTYNNNQLYPTYHPNATTFSHQNQYPNSYLNSAKNNKSYQSGYKSKPRPQNNIINQIGNKYNMMDFAHQKSRGKSPNNKYNNNSKKNQMKYDYSSINQNTVPILNSTKKKKNNFNKKYDQYQD